MLKSSTSGAQRPKGPLVFLFQTLLMGTLTAGLQAQFPVSIGAPMELSSYTTGNNAEPDVEALADGRFLVVWGGVNAPGDDSSVRGRFLSSEGAFLGPEMTLNTVTEGIQRRPRAEALPDGGFLSGWTSPDGGFVMIGTDQGAFVSRFASDGTPNDEEFQVNTLTDYYQVVSDVVATPDGGFLVAWNSVGSFGNDNSGWSIQARRYDADEVPEGDQFQVNTYTFSTQYGARLARQPNGDFVVIWGGSRAADRVAGRRLSSAGLPLGDQFLISSVGRQPELSMASDGSFVVAWGYQDAQNYANVEAQRFDSQGMPAGKPFTVTEPSNDRFFTYPELAHTEDDAFLVVWGERQRADPTVGAIAGRAFAADGAPLGEAVRLQQVADGHIVTEVAMDIGADPRMLVSWETQTEVPDGGIEVTVFGQGFELGLFVDGFESGATDVWSNAVP